MSDWGLINKFQITKGVEIKQYLNHIELVDLFSGSSAVFVLENDESRKVAMWILENVTEFQRNMEDDLIALFNHISPYWRTADQNVYDLIRQVPGYFVTENESLAYKVLVILEIAPEGNTENRCYSDRQFNYAKSIIEELPRWIARMVLHKEASDVQHT